MALSNRAKIGAFWGCVFAYIIFICNHSAVAQLNCARPAGSLPDPARAQGTSDPRSPIEHVIVLMQENHSFDNYFGRLNQSQFYGTQVDGVLPQMNNPNLQGLPVAVYHENKLCVADPAHDWNAMHSAWNQGANNGFVVNNQSSSVMGHYDQRELPFYYSMANQFAISDRYFASVMSQTLPNRFFLFTGTAMGEIANRVPWIELGYSQKTIFELLDEHNISWKLYSDLPFYLSLFTGYFLTHLDRIEDVDGFALDLAEKDLPQVVFIDSSSQGEDEHPSSNVQLGQKFVADRVGELVKSSYWRKSALFLTYDEGGGFFDHVPPPEACDPDGRPPSLREDSLPGDYKRLGFRVPFVAISPYVKRHFVSHRVYDHSSILRFIENKFNLPALTRRDANADGLTELFDFAMPANLAIELPQAPVSPTCSPSAENNQGSAANPDQG